MIDGKFVYATDEDTVSFLIENGFMLLFQSGDTFVFINNPSMKFKAENVEELNLRFGDTLFFEQPEPTDKMEGGNEGCYD